MNKSRRELNRSAMSMLAIAAALGASGVPDVGSSGVGPGKRTRFYYPQRPLYRAGRNEPCPCGSGRKFKRCCLGKTAASPVPLELPPATESTVPT